MARPIEERTARAASGTSLRSATVVAAGWHSLVVLGYVIAVIATPNRYAGGECGGLGCSVSLRDIVLFGGLCTGVPLTVISLLTAVLFVRALDPRLSSPFTVGTVSGIGSVAVVFGAAALVLAIALR